MTAFVACGRPRRCPVAVAPIAVAPIAVALAFLFAVSAADRALADGNNAVSAAASAGETVTIYLDQAKILKLPERTATLVVGNPLIADVAVQPGGILVVTGKSYGVTNLVALDRNGALLMEHPLQVLGPRDHVVTVHRGIERESYSCMPTCERRIMLGDTQNYFAATLGQTNNLNTTAQGVQPK